MSVKKILALVLALVLVCALVPAVAAAETEVRFDFGENGDAAHKDGTDVGTAKTYTEGEYELALTDCSKIYDGAYDAQGNSCIKLGTSSVVGTFTFTVPEDVNEVVIYAAKYKAKNTKLDVNGTEYTLSNSSNDGLYEAITVDTSATKSVCVATVASNTRAMIDAIVFKTTASSGSTETTESTEAPATPTTPEEIVNAAYALASGETLEGTYTLTGVITSVDTAYSAQYSNVSVWIVVGDMTDKPILCYRMKGEGADVIGTGDTITVTGSLTNYNGKIEFAAGCTLDSYVEGETPEENLTTPEEIVNAAYALEVGASLEKTYTLTGVISVVDTAYDTNYGNVTVTMVVGDMTDKPIQCYRLKGEGADVIGVGDTITVTGNIKNYNGTVEFIAGCTLDSYTLANPETTDPETTEPETTDPTDPDGTVLTIAEAIAKGSAMEHNTYTTTSYKVTGKIAQVYSEEYGNMYLTDDNGNTLTIYGTYNADGTIGYKDMEVKPVAGDTVTIYGPVGQYNGTAQIKNGWIVEHVVGEPPVTEPVEEADAEISFADTANRVSQNEEQQVWQQNGITVTNDKAASTTNIVDSSNPVRFYKNSKVTIAADGMVKIIVHCNNLTYSNQLVASIPATAGVTVTQNLNDVTIEFAEAVDSFAIDLTGGQVRVDSIGIYVAEQSGTVVGDFTGDGIVTNEDVVYLLWHTVFPDEYPISIAGDFTGDEQVTNEDVVYLLWHTVFPDEYPL